MGANDTLKQARNRKVDEFRRLHGAEDIVVLPCAWDVASAKVFEAEGYPAIGTTSAGVAASLGYADGQKIEFKEQLEVVRRIVRHVKVPVSVDVEAGYASTIEGVTNNVREILLAGAVGINIEDENHSRSGGLLLEPVAFMIEKIRAIRVMSESCGDALFINAKTDAIWLAAGSEPEESFQEAVDRANAYGEAGADCLFITGDFGLETIVRLVEAIPYPLNIVVKDETPPVSELRKLNKARRNMPGIRRLSMGSGPMRAAMGLTRIIGKEALTTGTYRSCLETAIPYGEVMGMFAN